MHWLILLSVVGAAMSHSYHLGSCPVVEPIQGFDINKFLGVWYAVQKTSTASSCLVYNITRGEEPGEYFLEQDSQHFILGLTPLQHEYRYTGELSVPDAAVPAKMRVKFPLSVGGSASFTVFAMEDDLYVGLFTCQSLAFAHRRSATILSRTKTLDKIYQDKVRAKLASFNVDPFDLSIISQTGCPKNASAGVDINIDGDTFSAASVAGVVRKAGEKIGDGVEFIADTSKKIYNKVTSSEDDSENPKSGKVMVEKDAEWLP